MIPLILALISVQVFGSILEGRMWAFIATGAGRCAFPGGMESEAHGPIGLGDLVMEDGPTDTVGFEVTTLHSWWG
jgi:hypothetical protein